MKVDWPQVDLCFEHDQTPWSGSRFCDVPLDVVPMLDEQAQISPVGEVSFHRQMDDPEPVGNDKFVLPPPGEDPAIAKYRDEPGLCNDRDPHLVLVTDFDLGKCRMSGVHDISTGKGESPADTHQALIDIETCGVHVQASSVE